MEHEDSGESLYCQLFGTSGFLPTSVTHLNKQPSMPNITFIYKEMSVVGLKHCFKDFLLEGMTEELEDSFAWLNQ